MTTTLAPHVRGDTFVRTFTLGNGWLGSDFTGGVRWTLRRRPPGDEVTDDVEAIERASVATGEITFEGGVGRITIPASRTTLWPITTQAPWHWDVQGVISGATPIVHTIDRGTIHVLADITRSQ